MGPGRTVGHDAVRTNILYSTLTHDDDDDDEVFLSRVLVFLALGFWFFVFSSAVDHSLFVVVTMVEYLPAPAVPVTMDS